MGTYVRFKNIETQTGGYITCVSTEGLEIGKLTYSIEPTKKNLIISYVKVMPRYEGNGYGTALVDKGIAFARKKKLRIYPYCSFAKDVLDRIGSGVSDVYPASSMV